MWAILDSNVLVSAVVAPFGTPAVLLQAFHSHKFRLVISTALIAELGRVLAYTRVARRTGWSSARQEAFVRDLVDGAEMVSPTRAIEVSRDPDDNRILEAAIAGAADYIVSGDRDLLVLGEFEGIPIVSPAHFLDILRDA